MTEILFKRISIENFLSIGEGSFDLDNRGLMLIQGVNEDDPSANSNGAGKSSTVDALCWALYGQTARGLTGDAVVNRFVGKNCQVKVTFTFDGKTYTVARHRKHSKGKNRLEFSCDGDDLTQGTDKLTQELIEKTIGCPLEVFTASVYSGQNNMPNLPAMTDKELKLLVENAAGIELLDSSYTIARERLRTVEAGHLSANHKLTIAAQKVEYLEDTVAREKACIAEWDAAQNDRVERSKSALMKEAGSLYEAKRLLDESPLEADLLAEIEAVNRAIASIAKPAVLTPPDPPVLDSVGSCRDLDKTRMRISSVEMEIDSYTRTLRSKIQAIKDGTMPPDCSTCGRAFTAEDAEARKQHMLKEAQAIKDTLEKAKNTLAELVAEEQRLHSEHEARREAVQRDNELRQRAYEDARSAYESELQQQREASSSSASATHAQALSEAHAKLSTRRTLEANFTNLSRVVTRMRSEHEALTKAVNPHVDRLATANESLNEAINARKEAEELVTALGERITDHSVVVEMFSPKGVRGEILDTVTPFLNARTAQYLGTLSDGSITAEWKTIGETGKGELREKFHIAVNNSVGAEVYEGLSGGEQRKVRVSTAMALQDLVAARADRPIKLFIADEADDALDVSGLERLMTILDDKARNVGTVLVISHNDLGDWISQQLTVVKKGGTSQIVEV